MKASSSYLRILGCVLVLLFACAAVAPADTLTPTFVDSTRGEGIWINEDGLPVNTYFAGVVDISVSENGELFSRDTFCVDLFTDIYITVAYNTEVVSPSDIPGRNLDRVAWLLDNVLLPTQGPVYTSSVPSSDWVTNVAQGAGLQLAIWDITTDGGDGFSSGRVQASTTPGETTDPAALAWAQAYLDMSFGQSSNQAFVYQNSDINSGLPAQMLEGPIFTDGGPTPQDFTPEPGTYLLAGGALIGLGLIRRRGSASR